MAKIKGNNNANLLNGTNNKDKIWGFGDDDIIDSFGGNDSIYAGTGADTVHGGNGHDKVDGGDGDDVLFGDAGNDEIDGGCGNDTISGGTGNDEIDGGKGTDTAVFTGNFGDYVIKIKNDHHDHHDHWKKSKHDHHDDKNELTVKDTVAGRDGFDSLSYVEFLKFADAIYEVATGKVTLQANPGEVRLYDSDYNLIGTYAGINAAIADAQDGYQVIVGAGTYTEQVVVNGIDNLTITGMAGVVIEAPAVLQQTGVSPTNGRSVDGLITVLNSSIVTI